MRYPRAFLVFNTQLPMPSPDHFKALANSRRSAYLAGQSPQIKSIEKEIDLINQIDMYFNDYADIQRNILVLSHPKIFDFLLTYFADKNLKIYWIDHKDLYESIYIANRALDDLGCMKGFLDDAYRAYAYASRGFFHLTKRHPHPHDDFIDTAWALSFGRSKTVLESELRVLLNQSLSTNVLYRFDL